MQGPSASGLSVEYYLADFFAAGLAAAFAAGLAAGFAATFAAGFAAAFTAGLAAAFAAGFAAALAAGFAAAFAAGLAAGLAAATAGFFFAAMCSHLPSMPWWQKRKKCSSGIFRHSLASTRSSDALSGPCGSCLFGGNFARDCPLVVKGQTVFDLSGEILPSARLCPVSTREAHLDFQSFPLAAVHGLILRSHDASRASTGHRRD